MALSQLWTKRIFARLLVRYGAAWLRMWDGVEMGAVEADWAQQLDGFEAHPDSIRYALENLPPDRPPTVDQFRALCRRAPEPRRQSLPPPKFAKRDTSVLRKLGEALAQAKPDPLAWAKALKAREGGGEALPEAMRKAWREALGSGVDYVGATFEVKRLDALKAETAERVRRYMAEHGVAA